MPSNISVIPVPKPAPFEYGGNPNQNAFLRQTASINNQLARNNAFMGGKIKSKSKKNKKSKKNTKSKKSKKSKKNSKSRQIRRKYSKRGGAVVTGIPVPVINDRYPSASAPSQDIVATQLLNAKNIVQSHSNAEYDKYASIK
jgi:hypothetical protein